MTSRRARAGRAGSTTRRRVTPLAVVMPLVLLLGACAKDAPQDTLDPAGPIARSIDNLWNGVFLIAVVVFVLVEFGTLALVARFRRRRDDDDLPTQTHGNPKLEIAWTLLPAVVLAVVGFFTLRTLFDINERDDDDLTVQVVGQQWWWEFAYDTDGDGDFTDEPVLTANDLVVPAGVDVNLDIMSNDVIHSFWIPRLNGKKDAVPGRTHPLRINADEPGTYVGQCTEFCGLSHGYMRQRVVALPADEFDAWLEAQQEDAEAPPEGTPAAAGAELFTTQCSGCHLARGINDDEFEAQGNGEELLVSGNAPDLTHFASRGTFAGAIFDLWVDQDGDGIVEADEIGGELNRSALEAWLRNPPAEKPMSAPHVPEPGDDKVRGMPNFNLQEEPIDQLVDFLVTLD
ncbi:MAG: cytochrome c oxidase subunit II [Acidimicrobiales bacterium]|nr:cytochrome c oxidase subunit II [Acidimicrobiales bacterium]